MALVPCHECGEAISELANPCPHCGVPRNEEPPNSVPEESWTKEVFGWKGLIFFIILFAYCYNYKGGY